MRARTLPALVGASILALAAPASAAEVETIAEGLDNPRHLAFGGDNLYVAEAGTGGDHPCVPGPAGGTVCIGATGAVTVVDEHGQRRIVEGLASFADQGTGAAAFGPHGVYVKGKHHVLITNGGPGNLNRDDLAAENPVADLFGRVLKIKRHGVVSLVDVWDFERDNNPDEFVGNPEVDSNAVDVLADRGRLVIADAGGNTLLKGSRHGHVEVLSVFPNRCLADPLKVCKPDEEGFQAVPTGVVKGPDGFYYMSQLTGFPFPVGAANVYRVDPKTGEAEVFASGFTNIMDLAFDEDGTLWVLEIDHDSLNGMVGPSTDGAIYAVDENGEKEQLELEAGTLTHPGGITVGKDGALYVTNRADEADKGEVLRIEVDDHGEDDDGEDCGPHSSRTTAK
jgi:sugar lactone lactonase YvrE